MTNASNKLALSGDGLKITGNLFISGDFYYVGEGSWKSEGSFSVSLDRQGAIPSLTGNSLVGVWDVDNGNSELINISTRGWVGTGGEVMIAGFIIEGDLPMTVAVTGWGPRLGDFGVTNVLQDPTLTVYQGETALKTNNDWKEEPVNRAKVEAAGLAPKYDRESAIVLTLDPGEYTAILSGVGGGAGNAIVAVWAVRPAQ